MYGAGTVTGPQTGVNTPRTSASLRPLTLTHGSLDTSFLVPTSLHYHASQLRDRFTSALPIPTDELAQDDEPSSVAELLARYMGFVADEIEEGEDDQHGSYEEVLRLVVNEFERMFLRGNDVHALAKSLPGILAKQITTVKCYYAARAVTNRVIKPRDSALTRAADDGNAVIYSIFGGQGNIVEYFDELREVYETYPSFVGE
jgi:fatty acid synthase subunit beta